MTKTLSSYLDRTAAVLLAVLLNGVLASMAFAHLSGIDTAAYGLPAANLLLRGRLALPQYGTQMGLDRMWLWNSPLMGLGPLPWFAALGVGRIPFLAGVIVLGTVTLAAYVLAFRQSVAPCSWALAVLLSWAVLGHRCVNSEWYNQRYSIAAFPVLLAAFWPSDGGRRWWQWLAAGCLPLVHPTLLPALAAWCAGLVLARPSVRGAPGPALFVACLALGVAWYGHPEALRAQFLPHLRYGGYRVEATLTGLLTAPASPIAGLPSLALNLAVAALAAATLAGLASRRLRPALLPALPAALAIAAALLIDWQRGFRYLFYYVPGLAPPLLVPLRESRPARLAACVLLALVAAANVAVSWKVDRSPIRPAPTSAEVAFLAAHTRPGDRIVLGFPFVFSAAPPRLAGDRTVVRLVPMPFMVDGFDERAYRREIGLACNVYIGAPEWFRRPVAVGPTGPPLFADAEVAGAVFAGEPVIVAQVRARPAPTAAPRRRCPRHRGRR